jgi:hypothetical protein
MLNYDRIMETVLGDATLVALLDTFDSNPAVFGDIVAPSKFTGSEYINFYHSSPINTTLEYEDEVYTLNCRSATHKGSYTIQSAVIDAFNRKASRTDGFYTCNVLSVIGPADETDIYNGPVEVRIKKR